MNLPMKTDPKNILLLTHPSSAVADFEGQVKQAILILTKNYPPQIGGIEKYAFDLHNRLVSEWRRRGARILKFNN